MNKLYGYLSTRLGKKTCPIKSISLNFDFGHNNSFKESLVIIYEDGTTEELIEKPKYENKSTRPSTLV